MMSSDCSGLRPLLDQPHPPFPHHFQPTCPSTLPLEVDQEDIPQETTQHILTSTSDSLVLDEYDNSPATEWSNQNSPYPPPQSDRDTPALRTPLGANPNLLNMPPTSSFSKQGERHREYVVEEEREGRYEGYKVNGLKNGFGSFYYREGGKYCGEWVEGEMTGRGVLYYSSGKIAYEGEWRANRLEGYGVLYNENIVVMEG